MLTCLVSPLPSHAAEETAPAEPVQSLMPGDSGISLNGTPYRLEGEILTLKDAINIGIEHNRDIQSSELEFEAAQNRVSETRANFGFDLSVEGNYQRVHDSSSFPMPITYNEPLGFVASSTVSFLNPTQTNPQLVASATPTTTFRNQSLNKKWQHAAEVKLSKPLITFGLRHDSVEAAKKQRESEKLNINIARLELILKVKKSFYEVLLAYKGVQTILNSVSRAEAHLDAARSRFDAGTSPRLDVIRAEGDVQEAREKLIQALKYFELARMNLNNTLGFPVDRNTGVSEEGAFSIISAGQIDSYYKIAMENRDELKQMDIAIDQASLQASISKKRPMVSLAGMWNFHNRGSSFASEHSWRAILAAQVPVFDQGLARSKEAQARRLEDKLYLKRTDLEEGIRLQVKQAYLTLLEAEQRLETSQAILETAEEAYRMADLGFKEGVTPQIDLVDAENVLTQARLNRTKADHDYEIAKAELARACGLPSLEEEE